MLPAEIYAAAFATWYDIRTLGPIHQSGDHWRSINQNYRLEEEQDTAAKIGEGTWLLAQYVSPVDKPD